jgi:hypothetical protein
MNLKINRSVFHKCYGKVYMCVHWASYDTIKSPRLHPRYIIEFFFILEVFIQDLTVKQLLFFSFSEVDGWSIYTRPNRGLYF